MRKREGQSEREREVSDFHSDYVLFLSMYTYTYFTIFHGRLQTYRENFVVWDACAGRPWLATLGGVQYCAVWCSVLQRVGACCSVLPGDPG